jgi:hypothetical protein
MKYALLPVCAAALLLFSCAAVPAPENPQDTLVIGAFLIDFPDGFFNKAPRKIVSQIELKFLNKTTGAAFTEYTRGGGYFFFLSNGTDSYVLKSFRVQVKESTGSYSFGGNINHSWDCVPGRLQYIGHFTYSFAHPKTTSLTGEGGHTTYWQFDEHLSWDNRGQEAQQYIQQSDPNSPWLAYELEG